MKYDSPQLLNLLAAEYVLGVMRGRARQRYERLHTTSPALRQHQIYWEGRLAGLALRLPPRTPRARVWEEIERRTRTTSQPLAHARPVLWDRAGFWQFVSMAAALAAITMGVLLRQVPDSGSMDYVAIVQADQGDGLWMITADMKRKQLRCKSMGSRYPISTDQDLELWMFVQDEAAPVSLGVLPKQGEMMMPLDPGLLAKFARAKGLAVSLEPAGGSRTGAPTGPVLFQAPPPLPA